MQSRSFGLRKINFCMEFYFHNFKMADKVKTMLHVNITWDKIKKMLHVNITWDKIKKMLHVNITWGFRNYELWRILTLVSWTKIVYTSFSAQYRARSQIKAFPDAQHNWIKYEIWMRIWGMRRKRWNENS